MLDNNCLIEHIEKIFDKNNNEIQFNKLEIKEEKRPHSSCISKILYIDNIPCNCYQMKSYKIQYLCRCNRHINILLHKYISKRALNCMHCLQDRNFDDSIYTKPYELKKGIRKKEVNNIKKFEDYPEEFKNKYKTNHLTEEEFYKYLPYIFRLNNIILNSNNINNIKYKYYDYANNQLKFTSKISFDNGLTWNSIKDIALQCSVCGKIFKIHLSNLRSKILDNIRCKGCNFSTKEYKIELYKNTNITYQSLLELSFLNKCYDNNIKVINGIEIPYYFRNKLRTYITDFYLPDYKYIIEIKGSNPYYFEDIQSGKLEAKNNAAIEFAKQNNMKFKFILDDIESFFNVLLNI